MFCHEKQGIASQPLKATFRADVVHFPSCDFFNSKDWLVIFHFQNNTISTKVTKNIPETRL